MSVAVIAGSTEGEGEGSCGGSEWAALSGAAVVGAGGGRGAGECDGGAAVAVAVAVVGRFVVAGGAVVRA